MTPEKRFENKVKTYLSSKGAWVLKTFSNGVQRSGVPDLLVCLNGIFVAVEVKAEHGRPSELQEWNVRQIRKAGGVAIVLYPKDFEKFESLVDLILILDIEDRELLDLQLFFDR